MPLLLSKCEALDGRATIPGRTYTHQCSHKGAITLTHSYSIAQPAAFRRATPIHDYCAPPTLGTFMESFATIVDV